MTIKTSVSEMENVIAALALKRFFEGKNVALRLAKVLGSFTPPKNAMRK